MIPPYAAALPLRPPSDATFASSGDERAQPVRRIGCPRRGESRQGPISTARGGGCFFLPYHVDTACSSRHQLASVRPVFVFAWPMAVCARYAIFREKYENVRFVRGIHVVRGEKREGERERGRDNGRAWGVYSSKSYDLVLVFGLATGH